MCDANNVPACRSLIDSCGLYLEVNQPCIACTVAKRGAWVPSVPEQEGGGGSHVVLPTAVANELNNFLRRLKFPF